MNRIRIIPFAVVGVLLTLSACTTTENDQNQKGLHEVYAGKFLLGAAISDSQLLGKDETAIPIILNEFNTITAENDTKWESIQPNPGEYNFTATDKLVELGLKKNMFIVGHTLVWHHQTPAWVFEDENGNPTTRDTLLARMKDHIYTVVGRYKGQINGWDVVNEALNDDGTLRDSKWRQIIGDDYIEKAFEYARQADPNAELYYNDYSLASEVKRNGAVKLVNYLKEKGVKVSGIGMQGHYNFYYPEIEELEKSINAFSNTGCDVMITELDITVLPIPAENLGAEISNNFELRKQLNPYVNGCPDSVSNALANRYHDLFEVFIKHHSKISRITFWGVHDDQSWKNDWPVVGRTDYPLIFDRSRKPKKAYSAIYNLALKN